MANLTEDQVVEYLSNLTVMQIAALTKTLEDKWGVKAAARPLHQHQHWLCGGGQVWHWCLVLVSPWVARTLVDGMRPRRGQMCSSSTRFSRDFNIFRAKYTDSTGRLQYILMV